MVEISPTLSMAINFAAFSAFIAIGGMLLYLGRSTNPQKKITFPWINLAFGTFLIGLNYLVQTVFATQISGDPIIAVSSYLLILGGTALAFTSFAILYVERSNEANSLRTRHEELKEITTRLRKKFLSRELPEEEMKRLDIDIVRELAEIEVKLGKLKRKPKGSKT